MTTTDHASAIDREHNLAQPFAPHRVRIYFAIAALTGFVFVGMTIGVAVGAIPATMTSDIIANLLFGVPVILLPLVIFWEAKGEQRSRLERSAELTLVYLPYTVGSQLGYELLFLIGHPLGWWTPTSDPGWKWLWWQFGLTDGRYNSSNAFIFGLECVGVLTGIVLFVVWLRLVRPDLPDERRIRNLWVAFAGIAVLMSSTGVYYASEIRVGFADIGQGPFGFWFKFIAENVPFIVLPAFVLFAIYRQVDYLTRRAGAREAAA